MEGNLPAGSIMQPGASYGVLDLQGNAHMHRQHHHHPHASFRQQQKQQSSHCQIPGSMFHPHMSENLHLSGNHMQGSDMQKGLGTAEYGGGEHGKTCISDDEEPSLTEDATVGLNEHGKGKKGSLWHRMKWNDVVVKLLITAVSYVGEDVVSECGNGGRRKYAILQKKGKWKAISKVMAERGYYVSPQQCEDKFNDLNKRYKRLTDILGRGTSCKVVENPLLLDCMNISEKLKDDARKILSSKQLFYEEMCSYHNGNRINLPPDPVLQHSLQLALTNRDDNGARRSSHDDGDEEEDGDDDDDDDDLSADTDDDEEDDNNEQNALHGGSGASCFGKRMKLATHEDQAFKNASGVPDCTRSLHPHSMVTDINQIFAELKPTGLHEDSMSSQSIHLEEKRLQIQAQMLELEKQRFRWQRFSSKKERELNKMRVENERMKLENERLSLELKRKELEIDLPLNRNA